MLKNIEKCSQCGKKPPKMFDLQVDLSFGYGSQHDTEHLKFCSDECFFKWSKQNDFKFNNSLKELEEDWISIKKIKCCDEHIGALDVIKKIKETIK